jgi:Zn-dependent protease
MDQSSPFSGDETAFAIIGLAFWGLGCLMAIVMMVVHWKLIQKTGNNGAISLLLLVPLVNIGVYLWLAFSEWPIEAELKQLKTRGRQPAPAKSDDDWE